MFFDRLQSLCVKNGTDVSSVLRALGLSTSKGTAWKSGAMPKGDVLLKLANYFHVSTDYLLGNTDDPSPVGQNENLPAQDGEKSQEDAALIKWFRSLPEEKQKAILIALDAPKELI